MGSMTLPPGFRFHPTDDELVGYYLKRKVDNLKIELEVIPVIDLYKFEPWELPEKSFLPKRDLEWFFFCPRDRKYPNGSRTNRATTTGYWKATGKDRKIACEGGSVYGLRKTLVFYKGRAPGGERTDWVMHEYRLCQDLVHGSSNFIGAYALCRVIKRHEAGLQGEPAKAKGISSSSSSSHQLSSRGQLSKVSSSSSLVTTDHQFSRSSAPFTPTNSSPPLDIISTETCNAFQVQNSLPYGGEVCDVTATATNGNGMPSSMHSPLCLPMCMPQDAFFIGGGDFPASESHSHMPFFGDMGSISEHELKWDNLTCTNSFSTTGAELWNPPNATSLLCRQASDGDDLTAWLPSDENMVVF